MFTILLYHGIDAGAGSARRLDATDREYVLDRTLFERHVAHLAERRIPVRSLDACLHGDAADAGSPPVVLTFDDGDLSCYTEAAPIVERYGFRAEFFIVSQWIEQPGFLTRDHVRELVARGHGVHSHSRTHPVLPSLPTAQIDEEVLLSKAEIERMTGVPVRYFSIPGGAYDARVVEAARRAGYVRVLSSAERYNEPGAGTFLLGRFTPRAYTSVQFVDAVCRRQRYTKARLAAKRLALAAVHGVLGARYGALRRRVLNSWRSASRSTRE